MEGMIKAKNIYYGSMLVLAMSGLTSCIDEDMSDCPPFSKEIVITYRLEVAQDVELGFGNEVNSLHLGFWNTPSSLFRERIIPKSEFPQDLIFRVTLPVDNYSHIAMANCEQHDGTHISFPQNLADASLRRKNILPDTIVAAQQPAYTGNLVMNMGMNYDNEMYKVTLLPASSKYVIHIEHPETFGDVKCFIQGTKESYLCWEQVWRENEKLVTDATGFASRDEVGQHTDFSFYASPTAAETALRAVDSQDGLWKLYVYSTFGDKTMQHIFTVKEPVAAGKVFEGTFVITDEGGESVDVETGVEFDPDWKPGNDFDIEM